MALPTTMTQHPIEPYIHQDPIFLGPLQPGPNNLGHAQQYDPTLWVLLEGQAQQRWVGMLLSKSGSSIDPK